MRARQRWLWTGGLGLDGASVLLWQGPRYASSPPEIAGAAPQGGAS